MSNITSKILTLLGFTKAITKSESFRQACIPLATDSQNHKGFGLSAYIPVSMQPEIRQNNVR